MAHETAKQLLRRAVTPESRAEAIIAAMELGMPLLEIEDYLDWLDNLKPALEKQENSPNQPRANPNQPS